ncbi:hypothetical protein J2792_004216, partial [Novosphingobium capsulatum]|nr:hypothetical protein [Novosphingobium capsulatum]
MELRTILGRAFLVMAASSGSTLALAQSTVSAAPKVGVNDAASSQESIGE